MRRCSGGTLVVTALVYVASCSSQSRQTGLREQAVNWVQRAYSGERVVELDPFAEDLANALSGDELKTLLSMNWHTKQGAELLSDPVVRKAIQAVAPRLERLGATASRLPVLGLSSAWAEPGPECSRAWDAASNAVATLASAAYQSDAAQVANVGACAVTGVGIPVCVVGAIVLMAVFVPSGLRDTGLALKQAINETFRCAFGTFDDPDCTYDERVYE